MNHGYPALESLTATIESRKQADADTSYTSSLLEKGMKAIGAKVMEEAKEFVTAAHELEPPQDKANLELREHLVHEAADLIYHTMGMLAHYDLSLSEVESELKRRFGTSGLEEKASRKPS
jgi:phosphoribosyl-ATP pyrophosphohydrolase